ncbi:hypothetical protein IWW38_003227, partial [Coemansia aciculifera]
KEWLGGRLAVVHVAEVSTLHRVACVGMASVVPPALALEQHFAALVAGKALGPAPQLPALVRGDDDVDCSVDGTVRSMALLVSRHGLVEMAYPLRATRLVSSDEDDVVVALGSLLGESLFSRIHPEDVGRVVKALRLAWDARPDAYHFARLRRLWQQKKACAQPLDSRQVLRMDGVEVANGVAALTLQLQVSETVDWSCAESMAQNARFARMQLTRWPLVLRPPRSSSSSSSSDADAEPHDGFVLASIQLLAEPARARYSLDAKKRSISSVASSAALSVASSSTLVVPIPHQGSAAAVPGSIPIPSSLAKRRSSIAPASLREPESGFGTAGVGATEFGTPGFGTPRSFAL